MTLTRLDLWRVFWRSLFIQAGFNPQSMQSLGIVYALQPALQRLYPDETTRNAVVQRHLTPFNTHPYTAAAIVGGILFHEIRIAKGEETPETVVQFKKALMGPLAALGDGFFWHSLRPAVGTIACATTPFLGAWSALVLLVLFNSVHLISRARMFLLGLRRGDALVQRLSSLRITGWGARLRAIACAVSGGLAGWMAVSFGDQLGNSLVTFSAVVLGLGGLALWLIDRGVNKYLLMYAMAGLAIVIGAAA